MLDNLCRATLGWSTLFALCIGNQFVNSVSIAHAAAQATPDECVKWLSDFERLSYGKAVHLEIGTKKCVVETSSDGAFRRSIASVSTSIAGGPEFSTEVAKYLAVPHSWCFTARANVGDSTANLRLARGDESRILNSFYFGEEVVFGFLDHRPMARFAQQSHVQVDVAPSSVVMKCVHPSNGSAVFKFSPPGRLASLEVRKRIGDRYSDIDPPLDSYPISLMIEFEYQIRDGEPDYLNQVSIAETRSNEAAQRNVKVKAVRELNAELGEKIDFPAFQIKNGTRVQVENNGEIDQLRYEFHDGYVVKVADKDAVAAARAARYSLTSRSTVRYYLALLFFLISLVVIIYVSMRKRSV